MCIIPVKPLKPFVDHPSFDDPAAYRELLSVDLPPLPSAILLVDDEDYVDQTPPKKLDAAEECRAFLLLNANRKRVCTSKPSTGRANFAARVQHMTEYIARCNMALVGSMWQSRKRHLSIDASVGYSVGMGAVLKAVNAFDVSRGFKFSTYCCRAILNAFASQSQKVKQDASRLPMQNVVDESGRELVAASTGDGWSERREALMEALRINSSGLTSLERLTIQRHLGIEKMMLQQIADAAGVSKETVRKAEIKAVAKLRAVLCEAE